MAKESSTLSFPTMPTITKNEEKDYKKFFVESGEPGFSPERNKAIIEKSIRKYEAMRKLKMKEHTDGVAERTDAILHFLKSDAVHSTNPLEKYFGRNTLAYLRGEQIRDKLDRLRVVDALGRIRRK